MSPRRTVRLALVYGAPTMRQVQYRDPITRVWCDYGDPVPADQADAKMRRAEAGEMP